MEYSQNSLTSCIYEMALGRASWDSILDTISAALPGCLITASGDDTSRRSNLAFAHRGLHPAAAAAYIGTFSSQNPWMDGQARLATLQVFHDDQLVPRRESLQSAFCKQWLAQQGDYSASTGVVVLREGTRQLTLEARYPEAKEGTIRERAASVLGDAAQHLSRAIELSRRSRFSAGRGYLDNVVADLPFTLFFVDRDMRIHYANDHADALRRRSGAPFTSMDGTLRATDEQTDGLLRQLVSRTRGFCPVTRLPCCRSVVLTMMSVTSQSPERRLAGPTSSSCTTPFSTRVR